MTAVHIENNSKSHLIPSDFNISGNKNICPFTLDPVEDCGTRNSMTEDQLCFFMLETCYFPKQNKLKKSLLLMTGGGL